MAKPDASLGDAPDGDGDDLAWLARDLGVRADADYAVLALREQTGSRFEITSAWGAPSGSPSPLGPGEDEFIAAVSNAAHPLLTPTRDGSLREAAGAPVRAFGGRNGALRLGFTNSLEHERSRELILWLLESYARLAALCVHDESVLAALRAAERRDTLTGFLTDAAVRYELSREISRAARHRVHLSCCFIDLDRFKGVNTRYGHLQGSRVLANIAAALRASLRASDSLGRFGGDEFVAVLPSTDERSAGELADRLREGIVSALPNGVDDPPDASGGVAQWQPGSSAEELLEAADVALRTAKAAGSGHVQRASELASAVELAPGPDWRRS